MGEKKRNQSPNLKNHGGGRSDKNKNGSEWEFNAVGRGFNGGLEKLCRDYGVNV